jgi:Sortilin, neurotensin receptor 3,/Sortilin, neurotensin receptor 3, C-terminal
MYTTDGFDTDAKLLRGDTAGCYWAKSTPLFTTGDADLDADRILCIAKGEYSPFLDDYRLLISDYYFNSDGEDDGEFEPNLEPGRTVSGVVNMAIVKKYLVAAAMSKNTDEMALYVTDDTLKWHRAEFPHDHKLREKAYTILESTNYSIQLDVLTGSRPRNPMGVLLSSNSNGTYFTRNIEHTNRNPSGYVDFEKIAGVQGIIIVNTVDNWEDVRDNNADKNVVSSISFDDGRTWVDLKTKDNKRIHLHSVTDMSNSGRVFSSPAPGLVMGIGNTGGHRKDYSEGDLYVSDDAGLTWERALKGPHKYEFGDQGSILVAIAEGPTDVINYSLDHGKTWTETDLPVDNFKAEILTTTLDSTSLKFLLVGTRANDDDTLKYYVMSIDFDDMHERTCGEDDLKPWYARVDSDGEGTCLMGHKQYYMRRTKDADCFIKQEFKDPEVHSVPCECTDADFECDFNFVRSKDRKKCVREGNLIIPDGECKAFDEDTTFLGSSGWRLIPGNDCERGSGEQKDDLIPWKCSEAVGTPASGKVTHIQKPFTGSSFVEKIYLERTETSTGEDESIVARTSEGHIYLSKDHGKTWDEIERLKKADVKYIIPHTYFNDVIYFVCSNKEVYYSIDRGNNVRKFGSDAPSFPDSEYWPIMNFHPKHKDWIIWVGVQDESCVGVEEKNSDCHAEASITEDRGDDWKTLQRYVRKCEFVPEVAGQRRPDKLIYCAVKAKESASDDNNPWQLVSSDNFFVEERTPHFDDIIDFATMSEFIVVATKDEETNMKAEASVDGSVFAEALFPPDLKVPHQSGYTALDSSTHSIFLLVTTESSKKYKYGALIKSNSNGTSYVLSLSAVNQDADGYVDFEKTLGIEGVALANIVANAETAVKDEVKKLKTKITHNDGADWALLPPPEKDVDGNAFECTTASDKCSLHIHGFTERDVKSHTYSSPTAVGLMLGIGNVGEYLTSKLEADTFISTDAGITWKQVKKGPYMWEFGDQGSIIVLVKAKEETSVIHYSRDEGSNWIEYEFSNEPLVIDEITTVPSDNSRNFVLWAKTSDGLATINLDFTGLTDVPCMLDESNGDDGDYYLWKPEHPLQDDGCLFGHISQYHRKNLDADCYNGRVIKRLHNIVRNCTCTRRDFEW